MWKSSPEQKAWHATSSENKAAGTLPPGTKHIISLPCLVPICSEKRREAATCLAPSTALPTGGVDVRSLWATLEEVARRYRVNKKQRTTLIVALCFCVNTSNCR